MKDDKFEASVMPGRHWRASRVYIEAYFIHIKACSRREPEISSSRARSLPDFIKVQGYNRTESSAVTREAGGRGERKSRRKGWSPLTSKIENKGKYAREGAIVKYARERSRDARGQRTSIRGGGGKSEAGGTSKKVINCVIPRKVCSPYPGEVFRR